VGCGSCRLPWLAHVPDGPQWYGRPRSSNASWDCRLPVPAELPSTVGIWCSVPPSSEPVLALDTCRRGVNFFASHSGGKSARGPGRAQERPSFDSKSYLRSVPRAEADVDPAWRRPFKRTAAAARRALVLEPELLILDEPTEGIQPNIVHEIGDILLRLNQEEGLTVLASRAKASVPTPGRERVLHSRQGPYCRCRPDRRAHGGGRSGASERVTVLPAFNVNGLLYASARGDNGHVNNYRFHRGYGCGG
jgi:hypothetical protein